MTFHITFSCTDLKKLLSTKFDGFIFTIKELIITTLFSRTTCGLLKTTTNYGIFNIIYQGGKIWNAVSDNIYLFHLSIKFYLQAISILRISIPLSVKYNSFLLVNLSIRCIFQLICTWSLINLSLCLLLYVLMSLVPEPTKKSI